MKTLIKKILNESNDLASFGGWVNVKIDKETAKRVRRLMLGLGFTESGNLRNKLRFLSNPVEGRIRQGESVGQALNRKISAMMLLQYLREIKMNFNSSTAGFLLEDFMAGLLGGEVVPGKGAVDVRTSTTNYQFKFYAQSSAKIKISNRTGEQPHKTILCLKGTESVDVYELAYDYFLDNIEEGDDGLSINNFKMLSENNGGYLGRLDFSRIDQMTDDLNADLKGSVSSLWDVVSELQFNLEAMLTGIEKTGDKTTSLRAANAAQKNTKDLDTKIDEVRGYFRPKTLA
jgi:hypothetical protein